jgi:hypothetical protein
VAKAAIATREQPGLDDELRPSGGRIDREHAQVRGVIPIDGGILFDGCDFLLRAERRPDATASPERAATRSSRLAAYRG